MQVEVEIVNAFVDGKAGGNPAGLVLNADELDKKQKLKIAKLVNLSETAFVSKSNKATVKLEFFTPTRQIAHCGHATIAAFCRMRELGILKDGKMSKETIDGTREIILDNGMAYMEQKAPSYFNIEDDDTLNKIAASIGSNAEDAQLNCIVNTGNSFLLVHLPNQQSLSNLKPNQNLINEISEQYDLIGYYAFTKETSISGRDASARMFAPRFGIAEESATGMAAGPLTCYLHDILNIKKNKFLIEQGRLMSPPSPSIIHVELQIKDENISRLLAGGYAKASKKLTLDIQ